MLTDHKIIRLKQEHHRLCRQRYSCLEQEYIDILCTHDLREPYPGVGDILTDAIIEDLIWNTALDEMPRIFSRAVLSENLPRIIKQFRLVKVQEILATMRRSRPSANISELHLATAFRLYTLRSAIDIPPNLLS